MMNKNSTIAERISYIIDNQYNGNQKKFSESIDYKPQVVSNIIGGRKSKPSFDVLKAIISSNVNINSEWLLTGNGDFKKKNNRTEETPLQYNITPKGVPYYDVDFTASFLEVENNQQSQPDSYISHPFFKDCELVVRASGQSMAKLIRHGDAIGLTRIENWSDFIPMGEIYAIVTRNNFRMIKIITKGDTPEDYTLISKPTDAKKEEFPPQPIKKTQILHIFKVQASAHLF